MLYVGCGNCRAIVPLFCAGRFMPHMPTYVDAGPMGVCCPYRGPLASVFTCLQCGVTQMMYVAGSGFAPQSMPSGGPSTIAPAVQAPAGASGSQLTSLLMSAGKSFLSEFAGHAGGQFGDQFGKGASEWASSWFGGDGQTWQGGGGGPWDGGGGQYW